MLVITGGAGFIGSAIAQELNSRGRADFIIVDDIDHPEKDKNIVSIKYQKLFGKNYFLKKYKNLHHSKQALRFVYQSFAFQKVW